MILIGSYALKHHIDIQRQPLDIDILGEYHEVINFVKKNIDISVCYPINNGKKLLMKGEGCIYEAEISWENSIAEKLSNLIMEDEKTITKGEFIIPSLNVLYMLKMTHRYLKNSPHFKKTMDDISLMRKAGAFMEEGHKEFYELRIKDTYDYGHPKLNVNKKDFFKDDGIIYVYDHDDIHKVVARGKNPAYTYYMKEDSEVFSSKEKFFKCTENIRLSGVLEESYVLALERSQIPFKGTIAPMRSFEMALMKVCTSITSGWFREYAWENYYKVLSMYDDSYVDKFWSAVDKNEVKMVIK